MSDFWPAKQILPRIWIGSKQDAHNRRFLDANGITTIVNCTRDVPFTSFAQSAPLTPLAPLGPFLGPFPRTLYRIPVDDHPDENWTMASHLPRVVAKIRQAQRRGQGVLVHCYAGISRSATVVAAVVMREFNVDPDVAIAVVRTFKRETFTPAVNFRPALDHFFSTLHTNRK